MPVVQRQVGLSVETFPMQPENKTIATRKVPLCSSATLQMVSFHYPLNNKSFFFLFCLPGLEFLNGYDAKWKQISGALPFN